VNFVNGRGNGVVKGVRHPFFPVPGAAKTAAGKYGWGGRIIRRCAPHPSGAVLLCSTVPSHNVLGSNLPVLILPFPPRSHPINIDVNATS